MVKNTARGVRYLLRFNVDLFLAQGDQVYLFLAFYREFCDHDDGVHVYVRHLLNTAHIYKEHRSTVAVTKGQSLKRWCYFALLILFYRCCCYNRGGCL